NAFRCRLRLPWIGSRDSGANQKGAVFAQESCRRRNWRLCAPDCQPGAGKRGGSSTPDSRRIADRRGLKLNGKNIGGRMRAESPRENIFPNWAENLGPLRNFDLSGMPISA